MKQYKYIIFDFDGTINNTYEGIAYTFKRTLDLYNIDYSNVDFNDHIGPPLDYSFQHLVGGEHWQEALVKYRQIYDQCGAVDMCQLYDGIVDTLQSLKSAGYQLAVATSKYQPYAIKSLKKLGIYHLFDYVYGQTETRGYKDEILASLLADNGWDKHDCLMIGDTHYDIQGAQSNGIDILAVSYGFESRESLAQHNPTAIVDSTKEIQKYLGVNKSERKI